MVVVVEVIAVFNTVLVVVIIVVKAVVECLNQKKINTNDREYHIVYHRRNKLLYYRNDNKI